MREWGAAALLHGEKDAGKHAQSRLTIDKNVTITVAVGTRKESNRVYTKLSVCMRGCIFVAMDEEEKYYKSKSEGH